MEIKKYLCALKTFRRDIIIWRNLKKKANIKSDEWGFVCNVANGDTYIFCSFMDAFVKKYGGKITIVVSESQRVIPSLFPSINRIVTIKELPSYSFGAIKTRLLNRELRRGVLSFGYPYTTIKIRKRGFNFIDAFKVFLKLDLDTFPAKPIISEQIKRKSVKIMRSLDLPAGKTVILAPYATAISQINDDLWYKIRDLLVEKGFKVATNIGPKEKPIDGTTGLQVAFDEIIPIAEYAGWVIGVRSGLFDILSSADCKLTILYPKAKNAGRVVKKLMKRWGGSTVMDIFPLNYIGNDKKNLNEFEVENSSSIEILNKITQV